MSKKKSRLANERQIKSNMSKNLVIKPKTEGQKELLRSIMENDITIVYGPPGVGKTHLSVTYGLQEFLDGEYRKLVFTRPCVEAYGERLGFLPGDFNEKISPYMMPIFDILHRYTQHEELQDLLYNGSISTLPLAYQRGISFNDAYVVLDEAQNTQPEQVKMFLTRMGFGTKIVITGDPGQSDITGKNGLMDAVERLSGVDKIGIVELTRMDIVRNKLVDIIDQRYSVALD